MSSYDLMGVAMIYWMSMAALRDGDGYAMTAESMADPGIIYQWQQYERPEVIGKLVKKLAKKKYD